MIEQVSPPGRNANNLIVKNSAGYNYFDPKEFRSFDSNLKKSNDSHHIEIKCVGAKINA